MRIACKDAAAVSCTISNLIAQLEQPCGHCTDDHVVLTGTSPTGEYVTVRLLDDHVLDVDGGDDLLRAISERGCPCG